MDTLISDFSFEWDRGSNSFVKVPLFDHSRYVCRPYAESRWRFSPGIVHPKYFLQSYINLCVSVTTIDPEARILIGPGLSKWDPDLQIWRPLYGLMRAVGNCFTGNNQPSMILLSLESDNIRSVLAHEYMHWVLCTIPEPERTFITRFGDLYRSLDTRGYLFYSTLPDMFQRQPFLQDFEEAEADAFEIWFRDKKYPFGLDCREQRRIIEFNENVDLSWVPENLSCLTEIYTAIIKGEYTSRKNVTNNHSKHRLRIARKIEELLHWDLK